MSNKSDVPELVRYDHQLVGTREDISGMLEDPDGKYVRYDQAVEIIEELKRRNREISLDYDGLNNSYYKERHKVKELKDELAQIKAQEPIAYRYQNCFDGGPIIDQMWKYSSLPVTKQGDATDFACESLYASLAPAADLKEKSRHD